MILSSRNAFRKKLVELALHDSSIIDIEADLGGQNNEFQKKIPLRYFNFGIAESASIDICTGLAKAGFKPVFNTFAPFVALRTAEHVKLSLAYMNLPIIIASCYGGAAGGWFGTTHQSLEDLAIIRSMPNIRVGCPYGANETQELLKYALESCNPWYIRLGRNNKYKDEQYLDRFERYTWYNKINRKTKVCLISSGEVATDFCIEASKFSENDEFISHLHIIESDTKTIRELLPIVDSIDIPIIIVEEHRYFGSIAYMFQAQLSKKNIDYLSVNDKWPIYGGNHYEVLDYLGFSKDKLVNKINKYLF